MIKLALRAQRTHLGFFIHGVANNNLLCFLHHFLEKSIRNRLLQVETRAGDATLPCGTEDGAKCAIDCTININVIENDYRRLTTEFECESGKIFGGIMDNLLRCDRSPGKRDFRDKWM